MLHIPSFPPSVLLLSAASLYQRFLRLTGHETWTLAPGSFSSRADVMLARAPDQGQVRVSGGFCRLILRHVPQKQEASCQGTGLGILKTWRNNVQRRLNRLFAAVSIQDVSVLLKVSSTAPGTDGNLNSPGEPLTILQN